LRQRKSQKAKPTPAASMQDGPVVLRGKTVALETETMNSWTTGTECVWRRLQVFEQAGKNRYTALDTSEAVPFLLDDGSGVLPLVRPGMSPVDNTPGGGARWKDMSPELREFVSNRGSFRWPKTPKTAVENFLPVDTEVTVTGYALTGKAGDDLPADRVLDATHISVYGVGIMGTAEGSSLVWSIVAFVSGVGASIGCLAWGGWL
jgi:hypothetical protein